MSEGTLEHSLEVITPKLIINKVNDESARITPVVKSWNGVPGNGFSPSNTRSPQQFNNENTITRT